MGLFSKIAKLDPLAGRVMKDTAKATASVSKLSGGKDLAAKTLAKDASKLARASGAVKPAVASGKVKQAAAAPAPKSVSQKPAARPMPKPVTKPAAPAAPAFGTTAYHQSLRGRNGTSR